MARGDEPIEVPPGASRPQPVEVQMDGKCACCGECIFPGDRILSGKYTPPGAGDASYRWWIHEDCWEDWAE